MKRLSLAILFALPVLAFAAAPQISDVAFGQVTPGKRTVTVRYMLTGAPAVVTMDVQTNGVSIGAANVRYLSGDVNRAVRFGALRRYARDGGVGLAEALFSPALGGREKCVRFFDRGHDGTPIRRIRRSADMIFAG